MAVLNLYSKRQKELRGEIPSIYVYDSIPVPLRVQIIHIWEEFWIDHEMYDEIVQILRREYGVFKLRDYRYNDCKDELQNFLLRETDAEKVLDAVELTFRIITYVEEGFTLSESASDAVSELNIRFREHGVGYEYIDREIIRKDSELIHANVVKPVLKLLHEPHYQGAQQEFLNAHRHYRDGKNKEAINECLKAFESTMKAICDKRGWVYPPNATAKKLIDLCFDNELVPSFWQSHLSSLRNMLKCSIPTGRNNLSGHGQGTTPTSVPDDLTAYMLHMTASTLLFLATAEKNLP